MRPTIWIAGLLSVLLATAATAREPAPAFEGRMSLGHRQVVRAVPLPELAPKRGKIVRSCRRWRILAAQLGETYAGHRLRETVLERQCGFHEDTAARTAWSWPWSSLEGSDPLPPRLHRMYRAWEIRCTPAGERRRCAALTRIDQPDGQSEIVAHIVIDVVAGRESVLWRLFVPNHGERAQPAVARGTVPGTTDRRLALGEVRYRLGASEVVDGFPACGAHGCLMEADLRRGAAVVSRLWDGRALDLDVRLAGAAPIQVTIPADGFRAAFGELLRLRREDIRGQGR